MLEYFGTNLTEAGHYRWELNGDRMAGSNLRLRDLPFNPEELTNNLQFGEVIFYQGGGFTVLGISGSCRDKRGGTKSIFFTKEILTRGEMIDKILNVPIAKNIIEAMPFKINWG